MTTTSPNQPLTPAVFHILLALSSGERHGYGIMKQVELDSQGNVNMGAGTLYLHVVIEHIWSGVPHLLDRLPTL